ncbi:MAG: hypothetical protein QM704_23085 [Anaeromyxobacteraceae bacterium]
MSTLSRSFLSGAVGAAVLTRVHEVARRFVPGAPRMDVIGARGLDRVLGAAGLARPRGRRGYAATLAGDLVSNTAWYALVGWGRAAHPMRRGLLLGLAAGAGAVVLSPALGLGQRPVARAAWTPWMTVAWNGLGGLAAGLALRRLDRRAALAVA